MKQRRNKLQQKWSNKTRKNSKIRRKFWPGRCAITFFVYLGTFCLSNEVKKLGQYIYMYASRDLMWVCFSGTTGAKEKGGRGTETES